MAVRAASSGTLVIAGITYVVVALTRGSGRRPHENGEHGSRAPTILDERLARGEIDEEEYLRRRDLLRSM